MDELWKDIPGYEGIYQASTCGRIRSVDGKTTQSVRHGERKWKERILKPKACSNYACIGYRVSLWKEKKAHDYLVARLVAATFIKNNLSTNLTVNHLDGDRLNNNIENLEWLTLSDNIKYGFEAGQFPQKETILTDIETGETLQFRSQSMAGVAIGRNTGYISLCIRKSRVATAKDGKKYTIISTKKGGGKNK